MKPKPFLTPKRLMAWVFNFEWGRVDDGYYAKYITLWVYLEKFGERWLPTRWADKALEE